MPRFSQQFDRWIDSLTLALRLIEIPGFVSDRMTCPVVGLVGGVGSGKSTLARSAAARFGLVAIDGDAAGHRALANAQVQEQIRDYFGDSVFTPEGTIDRSRLALRVFGTSSEHATQKATLERISHPLIERDFHDQILAARAAGAPAVLLDAAVLYEAGWDAFCDFVVFVDASEELRLARVEDRGWTAADWRRREASQMSLDDKQNRSDVIIENSGTLEAATESLGEVIERLCNLRLDHSTPATKRGSPC